jgi:ATP-dependent protease HslVU (ClpYQ) peptidase subunit
MSCVVGVKRGGSVWIGADSAVTFSNGGQQVTNTPKHFRVGDALVGGAGSVRFLQLVALEATAGVLPRLDYKGVCLFADWLIRLAAENGCVDKDGDMQCAFLVAAGDGLYEICENGAVLIPHDDYAAIGAGAGPALGYLWAAISSELSSKEVIRGALQVASLYHSTVRPPFIVHQA